MSNETDKFYELLGVAPGASAHDLKEAYRDLAKVWHPDRFSHDPRLQQKAQEKLKEINDAYNRLTSAKAGTRTRFQPQPAGPHAPPAAPAGSKRPRLVLAAAAVFCAIFLAALSTLVAPGARRAGGQTPTTEREAQPASDVQPSDGGPVAPAAQPTRGRERAGRQSPLEAASGVAPAPASGAQQLRPMPTATVSIDPATGLLATRDCPAVGRMTYSAGGEPRQYCNAHKPKSDAQGGPTRAQDSRLKSVGKRLAAPVKWLGGGKGAEAVEARDARPAGGGDKPQDL